MVVRLPKIRARKVLDIVMGILLRLRLFDLARLFTSSSLTVLNYHRIDDPYRLDFDTFKPNVSATPEEFAKQMDYVRSRYSVITCNELEQWLKGEMHLPRHPLLITFDDGYYDNLKYAAPVLMERNLPSVIFLTTNFMGSKKPFYWDYVAYLFFHTAKSTVQLPLMGQTSWVDPTSREKIMNSWINMIKKISDDKKKQAVSDLEKELEVNVPDDAFSNLYLNWEQICEMSNNGFEFGSHTVNHPILTRIPLTQVDEELRESKKQIERRLHSPVLAFAYPNGLEHDFSEDILNSVRNAQIPLAFTLLPGPVNMSSVKKSPLTIRRIFLMYTDSFPRFAAKLLGLNKIL